MNNTNEENQIRETINYYVEGMRTHAVETLKRGFHDQAILCGYLGDEMLAAPIAGLYAWAESNPAPSETGEVFECMILSIEIMGRVASAKMRETAPDGVFIDYFHLLNDGNRWWIVSKLWDYEK